MTSPALIAAHTKGPWSVIDNSWETSTVYGPDGETVAECPINSIVTEDNQHELEPIKEANARLIGAAPELLEALTQVTDLLVATVTEFGCWKVEAHPKVANARDAIAKALGQ